MCLSFCFLILKFHVYVTFFFFFEITVTLKTLGCSLNGCLLVYLRKNQRQLTFFFVCLFAFFSLSIACPSLWTFAVSCSLIFSGYHIHRRDSAYTEQERTQVFEFVCFFFLFFLSWKTAAPTHPFTQTRVIYPFAPRTDRESYKWQRVEVEKDHLHLFFFSYPLLFSSCSFFLLLYLL